MTKKVILNPHLCILLKLFSEKKPKDLKYRPVYHSFLTNFVKRSILDVWQSYEYTRVQNIPKF